MEPKTAIPANVFAACVKVSYLIGQINNSLSNDQIKNNFFKESKFKNFIDELIKEAQNGKTTALALNLCVLKSGLENIPESDLKESIDTAIWHCDRAIDALYDLEGVNPSIINPFPCTNSRSEDD